MTSGKSTIGPILANVLGWHFYDLDKVLEKKEKMSVVEIFERKGEEYFRGIEKETLEELSANDKIVIALGGGTIGNEASLQLIKSTGVLVYLKVSPNILYRRLKNKIDRPLFKDLVLGEKSEDEFIGRIKELLMRREGKYNQADLEINTDETRIGITVDKIAKQVKSFFDEKN